MVNSRLFATGTPAVPIANTRNEAGGPAFSLPPKHVLAQLAATGALSNTFYTSAEQQLDTVLAAAKQCSYDYVAKAAIYARNAGFMKDMPALLVTYLVLDAKTPEERTCAEAAFRLVINNGRMIRNFFQIVRSGQLGRKSFGTFPKRLLASWFNQSSPDYIFKQSVGNDPELADVLALARPKPTTDERRALYGYLRLASKGKLDVPPEALPAFVREYESFRKGGSKEPGVQVPDVPFQMLDSLGLTSKQWTEVFRRGGYQFTRMNLNTALRQKVFEQPGMVDLIANRLKDREELRRAKQFPYQLMSAYTHADTALPREIINALHDAMELSCEFVPKLPGKIVVAVDTSGSMSSAIMGSKGDHAHVSKITASDVAGLFAASIVRANPTARVISFDTTARWERIEPRDTVATIAKQLSKHGGGTDCSAPVALINVDRAEVDLFIIVSDNQSWFNEQGSSTNTAHQWAGLKHRCPNAKQVRIDVQPYSTNQMPANRSDTLLVGGFSDIVFNVIGAFAESASSDFWVEQVDKIALDVVDKTLARMQ